MDQGIFRREAVAAQSNQWLGGINLTTPLAYKWLAVLAAVISLATILFLGVAEYTKRERVTGELVPATGILSLNAAQAGTIAQTMVHEGDVVSSQQALVEISSEVDTPAIGGTYAAISEQLRGQKERLRIAIDGADRLAAEQSKDTTERIRSLRSQLLTIESELDLQRRQANAAKHVFEKVSAVKNSGALSMVQLQQYESAAIESQVQVKTLEGQWTDMGQRLKSLESELAQIPLNRASKIDELRDKLSATETSLAKNEAARTVILRAPQAGTVATLLVKAGQAVTTGQFLLSVLPTDAKLQAQLLLPSSAIGFVRKGDPVVLRYLAFPYQDYGQQFGRVAEISRTALNSSEVASITGQTGSDSRYRVLVSLDKQVISAHGESERLLPGMALEADILLERRTLLQWMWAPIRGLRHRFTLTTDSARPQPHTGPSA